ncbi:unnamed protein product [Allacma fusca]|nr:unnamed protein product [Allacma fusca]
MFVMYLTTIVQPLTQMSYLEVERTHKPRAVYTFTLFYFVVLLMSSIAGFVMALILLKGSYLKNPFLLQTFMVYTVISYYISFVLSIAELYIDPGRSVKMTLFVLLVTGFIQGCFLWVVRTHREEILREMDQSQPATKAISN